MQTAKPIANVWNRRDFVGAATMLSLLTGVTSPTMLLSGCAASDAPSEAQRKLMRIVSELVLPRTGTKGAGEIGVGDFVILALAHGLDGSRTPLNPDEAGRYAPTLLRSDGSLRHTDWLETELNRRAKADFQTLETTQQRALLTALDAEAFAPGARENGWRLIKGLILLGYYTSEEGAANELRYELTPGRWEPDMPLKRGDRAWSSDWTAVEFG